MNILISIVLTWAIISYISLIIGVMYLFKDKYTSVADRIKLTALSAVVILSSPLLVMQMIKDNIEL